MEIKFFDSLGDSAHKLALAALTAGVQEVYTSGDTLSLAACQASLDFVNELTGSSLRAVPGVPEGFFVSAGLGGDARCGLLRGSSHLSEESLSRESSAAREGVTLIESASVLGEAGRAFFESSTDCEAHEVGDSVSSWLLPMVESSGFRPAELPEAEDVVLFAPGSKLAPWMVRLAAVWCSEGHGAVLKPPARQALAFKTGGSDEALELAESLAGPALVLDLSGRPSAEWFLAARGCVTDFSAELLPYIAHGKPIAACLSGRELNQPLSGCFALLAPSRARDKFADLDAASGEDRLGPEDVETALWSPANAAPLGSLWVNRDCAEAVERALKSASIERGLRPIKALRGEVSGRTAVVVGDHPGGSAASFSLEKLIEYLSDPVVIRALGGRASVTRGSAESVVGLVGDDEADVWLSPAPWPALERTIICKDEALCGDSSALAVQAAIKCGCSPVYLIGVDYAHYDLDPRDARQFPELELKSVKRGTTAAWPEDYARAREVEVLIRASGAEFRKLSSHGILDTVLIDEEAARACRVKQKKTLFIRCGGGLGDTLQLTPALTLQKRFRPDEHFTVMTKYTDVYRNNPHIDDLLIEWDGLTPAIVSGYESVYRLDDLMECEPDGSRRELSDTERCYDSYFRAVGLWSDDPRDRVHQLFPSEEDEAAVEAIGLPEEFVAVSPSYRAGRFGWTFREWEEIIERLKKFATVVMIGCSKSQNHGAEHDFRPPNADFDAFDMTANVQQAMLLLKRASGVLCWDSGTLHIAQCLPELPVCCVFGHRAIEGFDNTKKRAPALNPFSWVDIDPMKPGLQKLGPEPVARAAIEMLSGRISRTQVFARALW